MKNKIFLINFLVLLLCISSLLAADNSFSETTVQNNPSFSNTYSNPFGSSYENLISGVNARADLDATGAEFFDLQLMIPPAGCKPYVVRSDLLEEQNVPVFCEVVALKINPGVDISRISSISFTQKERNPLIAGIGFHPANAAIRSSNSLVNTPLNGILGYVVVVLKRQETENQMPENVTTVISASLDYNLDNGYGIGPSEFYLPVMTDEEFANNYLSYGFLDGAGYLRVEDINDETAQISIYSSLDKRVYTGTIQKGKTSNDIFISNTFGGRGLRINLKDISLPEVKAIFDVNGQTYEVYDGGRFADGKCTLQDIQSLGAGTGKVKISCGKSYDLVKKFNNIDLYVGGVRKTIGLGDLVEVPRASSSEVDRYYLAYIGNGFNSKSERKSYVLLLSKKSDTTAILESKELTRVTQEIDKKLGEVSLPEKYTPAFEEIKKKLDSSWKIVQIFEDETNKEINNVELRFGSIQAFDKSFSNTESEEYYKIAINSLEEVKSKFGGETNVLIKKDANEKTQTYGESALWKEYELAVKFGQLEDAEILLSRIENEYPGSKNVEGITAKEIIQDKKLFSSEGDSFYDEKNKLYITLKKVVNPTESEAGVDLTYFGKNSNGETTAGDSMTLGQGNYVVETENVTIKLESFTDSKARFSYTCSGITSKNKTLSGFVEVGTLKPEIFRDCGNVQIKVNKIMRKQVAHVQITPTIHGKSRESNFTFSIGIEKRAIQLTPKEKEDALKDLNKQIAEWKNLTEDLGELIKVGKLACLGTSAALNLKNLFSGMTGGTATARNAVMTGEGGWNDICAKKLGANADARAIEKCIAENSGVIEKDVGIIASAMSSSNGLFQGQEVISKDKNGRVDSSKLKENVIAKLRSDGSLMGRLTEEQKSIVQDTNFANYSSESDIQELVKNLYALGQGLSPDMKQTLQDKNKAILERIKKDMNEASIATKASEDLGGNLKVSIPINTNSNRAVYEGLTWKSLADQSYTTTPTEIKIDAAEQVAIVPGSFIGGDTSKNYLFVLEGDSNQLHAQAGRVYRIEEKNIVALGKGDEKLDSNIIFEVYDENAYKNLCKGAKCKEARIFTTQPYKGTPQLLPYDLKEGWYVETKNLISVTGATSAYQDSGAVSSFWLCNVGKDGYISGVGRGDVCRQFNLNTGDSLDSFPGLSAQKTKSQVARAINAIKDAQSQLARDPSRKTIIINQVELKVVGNSGNDGGKCTDFMSASDCKILFNVCDPFVCPSSRCDLGGEYRVDDVIASGIIGSTVLCLPNFIGFRGEVAVPVCLTGIHAGIDGWVSILESYRDCLNESLINNKTTGICDQVHSIYVCDFFWKQAGPYVSAIAKNIFSGVIFGQKGKGGGEYMFVNDAWNNAEKSWQYFQTDYAENSKLAFGAKGITEIGAEFCKMQASAAYPDVFDEALSPESPIQLHAYFEESPYTSATVPARSTYKVFYHIYAGEDQGAYYSVYLKETPSQIGVIGKEYSTVASGYIPKGGYKTETKDFIDVSGFKQLCVRVNNKDHCGFKSVGTSFAMNYAKDKYIQDQATSKVTSEKECVSGSGTASVWGLVQSPNLQQTAEETLNPELYNYGVTRVCSSENPGKTVNPDRWKEVGYCDDSGIKCWLDVNSVKNAIKGKGIENATIGEINEMDIEARLAEGGVMNAAGNIILLKDMTIGVIGKASSLAGVQKAVEEFDKDYTALYEKLVMSNERALLIWVRALVYEAAALKAQGFGEAQDAARVKDAAEAARKTTETSKVTEEFVEISTENLKSLNPSETIIQFDDANSEVTDLYYRFTLSDWEWSADSIVWYSLDNPTAADSSIFRRFLSVVTFGLVETKRIKDYNEKFISAFKNAKTFEAGVDLLDSRKETIEGSKIKAKILSGVPGTGTMPALPG
jgi:hypothetical protein